jgi:hypothetical protein
MLCRVHKDERIVEVIFIGLVTKEIALSELKNLYDQLRAQQVSGYHLLVDLIRAESDIGRERHRICRNDGCRSSLEETDSWF